MNSEIQNKNNFEPFASDHSCMRGQKKTPKKHVCVIPLFFWKPKPWSFSLWQCMSMLIYSSGQRCLHVEDPASVPDLPSIPHSECVVSSLKVELLKRKLDHLENNQTQIRGININWCRQDPFAFSPLGSAFICKIWDLLDLTPRQCPCIDLHCMLKSF